ncbi:MAG: GtrA family protein [Streptosporangiaceae bacterium]
MSEGTIDQVKSIRDIYARYALKIHEIAKFGIVGGIGFVVQLGVTDGVHLGLGLGALSAVVVGYVVATVVTFLGNRHWAFKHRKGKGLHRETLMFVLLNVVGLGIQEAVVATVHYGLHMTDPLSYNVANIVGIGLGTLFRLWSYRKWVFLEVTDEPAEVAPAVLPAEEPSATGPHYLTGMHAAGEHVAGPRANGMHASGAHASGAHASGNRGGEAPHAGRHRAAEVRQAEPEPEEIYPQPSIG